MLSEWIGKLFKKIPIHNKVGLFKFQKRVQAVLDVSDQKKLHGNKPGSNFLS